MVRRSSATGVDRCRYREDNGDVAAIWSLASVQPSRAWLLDRWGSGSYRIAWLDASRRPCGTAPEVSIDLPDRPARGAYPNPPAPAPIAALAPHPVPVPEAPSDGLTSALRSTGMESIMGPLLVVRELMGMADSASAERERRREREHEAMLARMREQAAEDLQRLRAHYEGAARTQAAPVDAVATELRAMRERLERMEQGLGDDDDDDEEGEEMRVARVVKAIEDSSLGQFAKAWAVEKFSKPDV
jgi:hypothetical protein